ncbi:DEAD/DEAH box helicase [Rhodobacteraceae bacterium 2376]|uniref:DEAD/DEAH box helicase n=1 Tax=Rhabdonatronobacter sediminivivens TaxID=2743469 RepID=A0A7Z0KZG6_9RHOB|nr:DEAD/DEAH box helicase [Rhabdonatronobacter sediminivivens]NYS26389.1 DEAD/DEAH box helicase [Rhabdonatronobacter sediminivivens]
MKEALDFTIPRHAVPSDPASGLSPLQARMLDDPAKVRIFSAPTGAGKSYAFQKGMRERGDRILFIVPTRRLAQNLSEGLVSDLMREGMDRAAAESQVMVWTSDARMKQEEQNPGLKTRDLRIAQARAERGGARDGFMIIATPESVAWYLLNPALRKDGQDPENILDLLRLTHVVFDEFHTIDARGMGLSCALATITAQAIGAAKITFLSATPIDVKTTLTSFGIPEDVIAIAEEVVVTGDPEETAGMRAIHGDVEVRIETGDGFFDALNTHRALILSTMAREDDGAQVVLIYDSVRQLLHDKLQLAEWFEGIGVGPDQRLAVNSSDDSVSREMDGLFTIGRNTDPRGFKVLVATSSIEMGVTFKAGLIIMEPGHDACSLVQRIGRVARGDLPGTVVVQASQRAMDRHGWLRKLRMELDGEPPVIPIDRFNGLVLRAVRQGFDVTPASLDDERGSFRRMPQSAIWVAGLFWAALEKKTHYKGMRDTLRSFRPRHAARIGALLGDLERTNLDTARTWLRAFLDEAKRLRVILPKVTLVDPFGRRKQIPWLLYASTEDLLRSPARINPDGAIEVQVDRPLIEVEGALGGRFVQRTEEALFPHTGRRMTFELLGMKEAWLRAAGAEMNDPALSGAQESALHAASTLVRLTGIVPFAQEEGLMDGAALIF